MNASLNFAAEAMQAIPFVAPPGVLGYDRADKEPQ